MSHAGLPHEVLTEDEHWRIAYAFEDYVATGRDYEDYAPAYCVGYAGFAQYGGAFEDSERSLWANWERIRGDSRLTLEEALPAMRAAWDRVRSSRETGSMPAVPPANRHPLPMPVAA